MVSPADDFLTASCIVSKSLPLGKDTFSHGYISLDNIYKSVKILEGFAKKLDEYDLWKSYKALCTSGVREALNKYFFIDYIKNNTGIELEILEPSDEIYLKYLGLNRQYLKYPLMKKTAFYLRIFQAEIYL